MGAHRRGGQLVTTLLTTALGGVVMSPLASCGGSPAPSTRVDVGVDVHQGCGAGFSVKWDMLDPPSTYIDLGGYVPKVDEGRTSALYTNFSGNMMKGAINGLGTESHYLVEAHDNYIGKNFNAKGGERPRTEDFADQQAVTLEYIDNGNTLYAAVRHLIKPEDSNEQYYRYDTRHLYHRIRCNEHGGPTADHLYSTVFPVIDKLLGRDGCMERNGEGKVDPYKNDRRNYIEEILNRAGCANASALTVKPIFDCARFFRGIPKVEGSSYHDLMLASGDPLEPDPHTYTCPHRLLKTTSTDDGGKLSVHIKEYYADETHPMLSYGVIQYELGLDEKILSVKVFNHASVIRGRNNNIPRPHKQADVLTEARYILAKGGCGNDDDILRDMEGLTDFYRKSIRVDRFTDVGDRETADGDQVLESTKKAHEDLLGALIADWKIICKI